jgi:hypothetical protein
MFFVYSRLSGVKALIFNLVAKDKEILKMAKVLLMSFNKKRQPNVLREYNPVQIKLFV